MSRGTCPDCHGEGVIHARSEDPNGSGRSRAVEYECVECCGCGTVDVDPLDGIDEPVSEIDGVPARELDRLAEVALLAARFGGVSESTVINAARVVRGSEAA